MSGPIVRKYGFPNFEKIFGAQADKHGVDDTDAPTASADQPKREPASSNDSEKPPFDAQVNPPTEFGSAVE